MRARLAAVVVAGAALLGACGDDTEDVAGDTGTTVPTTEAPASTTTSEPDEPATSTTASSEDVAASALAAAQAWVDTHLPGTAPTLSEFRQGDARSGEVELFRPTEGGGTGPSATTLLLRLDDEDQWQVFAAVSDVVTIETPEQDAEVPAGPLTVSGTGRGFEGAITARAFDEAGRVVAESFGQGGALEAPEPYEITLDLGGVAPGTELVLVVAGGTGLDTDTGELAAIRVTVA